MLDTLKALLNDLTSGTRQPELFQPNDYRLAAAALLIHVVAVDGTMSDVELNRLRQLLMLRFGLDDAATAELIEAATAADRDAIDLYHFTRTINRSLDEAGRERLVEMMWEVVYADGRATEFEENVIWRAADLLGVSSEARIALRNRVAGERGKSGGD